jgi:hypothetical protein
MMNLLATTIIDGNAMVKGIILLIGMGMICGLVWWLIDFCKIPDPFRWVCRAFVAIFAVLLLINFILSIVGSPIIRW